MKRVAYEEMVAQFTRVLEKHGFTPSDAKDAAVIFAQNSLSGVYSHGLNRFPRVVSYLEKGEIDPLARAECISRMGSMERWDGHRGFGPLNAQARNGACRSALATAERRRHRGAGQQQPLDARRHLRLAGRRRGLHRHLLVQHLPPTCLHGAQRTTTSATTRSFWPCRAPNGEHVMVDCALSQFSYGKLESDASGRQAAACGRRLRRRTASLTTDPAAIEKSGRALPIGYWKGSGLSILLDMIGTLLSGGKRRWHTIGTFGDESRPDPDHDRDRPH